MGKTYRNLPYILLFSCFLLIGFSIGRGVFSRPAANWAKQIISGPKVSRAIKPASVVATGQRNILLIGVDDLNSNQPRLESVWLVLYLIDHPQVILLPIYPLPPEIRTTREEDPLRPTLDLQAQTPVLGELFNITPDGAPDPVFLEALQAKDIWWSGYILIDEFGIAEVVEASRKLSADSPHSSSGVRAVAEIPPAWDDPSGALTGQIKLAQTICRYLNRSPSKLDFSPLLDIIPRHVNTDLNLTRGTSELKNLLSSPGGLSCEFPTIRIQPETSP